MKKLSILFIGLALFSCKEAPKEKSVATTTDYETYLAVHDDSYKSAQKDKEYWSSRLDNDTTGIGDIGPLASAYTNLFDTTGKVENLLHAETLLKKAMALSANNKDSYARSLAHNYISQHRFKEAKEILETSYAGVSKKHDTELMLFDVYMELGEYEKAQSYLEKVKNPKDYHYLIRLSKWSDYQGNLDAAIKYMEQAKYIAESRNTESLKIWTYSNLGDYYGHAGRIKDSYNMYLKTLELQPDNAYVKKGIAWIAYAGNDDAEEATRILDSISKFHDVPDYLLLRAEMAEHKGDAAKAKTYTNQFIKAVSKPAYGDMYNAYLIEIYADINPEKAVEMALQEVENRPTPEAYHLLALAQAKAGNPEVALELIEKYVKDKTEEPMAYYHTALVYKANGMDKEIEPIKEELLGASFEIGPVLTQNVKNL